MEGGKCSSNQRKHHDYSLRGVNVTFPNLRPAREKARLGQIKKTKNYSFIKANSEKLSLKDGGLRSNSRVVLASGDQKKPIEVFARFFELNDDEKKLKSQYPYAVPVIAEEGKNIITCRAFNMAGDPMMLLADGDEEYYSKKPSAEYEETVVSPLAARLDGIISPGLNSTAVLKYLPVCRLLKFALDGGRSSFCFHGPSTDDNLKCKALFGNPNEEVRGVLPYAMHFYFMKRKELKTHSALILKCAAVTISPNDNINDILDPQSGNLESFWDTRKREFSVRPLRWTNISSISQGQRILTKIESKFKKRHGIESHSKCSLIIYLRVLNRPIKGANIPLKSAPRKQMEGLVAFIVLPDPGNIDTDFFSSFVLSMRRNAKEGYHLLQPESYFDYKTRNLGCLLHPFINLKAASVVLICSKLSPTLAIPTAAALVVGTKDLEESMNMLRRKKRDLNGEISRTPGTPRIVAFSEFLNGAEITKTNIKHASISEGRKQPEKTKKANKESASERHERLRNLAKNEERLKSLKRKKQSLLRKSIFHAPISHLHSYNGHEYLPHLEKITASPTKSLLLLKVMVCEEMEPSQCRLNDKQHKEQQGGESKTMITQVTEQYVLQETVVLPEDSSLYRKERKKQEQEWRNFVKKNDARIGVEEMLLAKYGHKR
jgi:hypothetical protein